MDHPLQRKMMEYLDSLAAEKGLLPSTISNYRLEIKKLLRLAPTPDATSLKNHLRRLAPATQWRKIVIWRSFLGTTPPPWKNLVSEFRTPKLRQKQPTFLTEDESFRLESVCYKTRSISRNRLLVALALQLGLRLSEILQLKFGNIEQGGWLKMLRKGGKEQRLPIVPALQNFLQFWKVELQARDEDWIFPGRGSGPMSPRTAQLLIRDLAKKAGIDKRISPHSLRHTFATTLASRGANLAALKELLGHQSIATTEKYLHVTPAHLKETLGLLQARAKSPS